MSKILRRPMFRGGPVDSYGTGIATGLASGGRVGYDNGGQILKKARARIRGPRDFGITNVNPFFNPKMNIGTQRKSKFVDTPLYEEFPEVSQFPLTADAGTIMTDATVVDTDTGDIENLKTTADVEAGLETTNTNPDEFKIKEVEKVKNGDDEVEVTMTDLEKALGLDKARRRDLGDMLGRASAAFFKAGDVREGLADFFDRETKAGPSRTERIKSIAGLEEYKSKKAKEIAEIKLRNKTYAPGNAQKNYEFFISLGIDKDQALNLSMGKARNFDEAFLNLSAKGTVTAKLFDTLARQEGIDPLPQVDIETLEVGETFYVPGAKSLVRIVLKEGKKDLIQTPY